MKELTTQLQARIDLTLEQVELASRQLADPAIPELEKADFLVALKSKGETGEELGYFARAFINLAVQPPLDTADKPTIDVCGTGGDRLELVNVSTATMFPLAAAGVVVLKHGNKAITSRCGGADVLERLGIPIACPVDQMVDCIQQTGIGFFFAPLYHPAFRVVAPVRKKLAELGVATIFNLLGPLLNPARPAYQLVGVFSPTILEKYAVALAGLGRDRAWVVHGEVPGGSGMDEISPLGETEVHEVKRSSLNYFHLFADQLGVARASLHELRGSDVNANAKVLIDILRGVERGPKRDFVLINTAAGLVVSGLTPRMESGLRLAAELIDSGRALEKLREFQRFFGADALEQRLSYCSK
ncbi:MAG: anthranilate phosphoribosyltransferase [Chthoniobacterales bacterium]